MIDSLLSRDLLPDPLIRVGIRRLLRQRIADVERDGVAARVAREEAWLRHCHSAPIAVEQDAANRQHYEVPADFYAGMLGAQRKYSSCWFDAPGDSLDAAEERALAITAEHAQLADGQRILELGCGWGSLTLWMARRYPRARIHAVSNSASQRTFILDRARALGVANIEVETCDLSGFAAPGSFDRVVSVECFEHLRNWPELLRRIRTWLTADGRLFIHVFTHRHSSYPFAVDGEDDWMGRHFFSGGQMPSDQHLIRCAAGILRLDGHWAWSGQHYARTAEHWLRNLDRHRDACRAALAAAGEADPARQVRRWRIFAMACAELWAYRGGEEWHVSHYRLAK